MKVAVVNTSAPFVRGGAEHLAESLVHELASRGHEVELVKVPLRWATPDEVAESMFAAACLRISGADRVIALKFPAYLVPHPNKIIWLLHQFRQVYDLWQTEWQDFSSDHDYSRLVRAVREADNLAFSEARAIYCNSAVTGRRLLRFNGKTATVLLPPHGNPAAFRTGKFGDYVLAIGRINRAKRQELLIEAMATVTTDMRLVVAGAPETPVELTRLNEIIAKFGVGRRVEVIPRYISDSEKVELLSGARAVAYIPLDEDSYGYVTSEAFLSGKPVLTATDSGGVLELVDHKETGLVAEPSPISLAQAIDYLADEQVAVRLGSAALTRVRSLDLSWNATIERLLR
jgi:glycosyltransferase involved in cell wall biosynthesis